MRSKPFSLKGLTFYQLTKWLIQIKSRFWEGKSGMVSLIPYFQLPIARRFHLYRQSSEMVLSISYAGNCLAIQKVSAKALKTKRLWECQITPRSLQCGQLRHVHDGLRV